jgi:hypothetical protein
MRATDCKKASVDVTCGYAVFMNKDLSDPWFTGLYPELDAAVGAAGF